GGIALAPRGGTWLSRSSTLSPGRLIFAQQFAASAQTEGQDGAASVAPYKGNSSLASNARHPGAQTERRAGEGACLAVRTPPVAFLCQIINHGAISCGYVFNGTTSS